jgi:tellurite methyltransferase
VAAGDRERWDRVFARPDSHFGAPPDWLSEFDAVLPRAGRALDVASGRGRVARFWARRGLETLAVDVSPVGLEQAWEAARGDGLAIRILALDLESDLLPDGPFAVVSCFHYLQRDLFPRLVERLGPGGALVCEIATVRNLERHSSPSARFLLQPGELASLCRPLEIVTHSEEWRGDSFLARVIARRVP